MTLQRSLFTFNNEQFSLVFSPSFCEVCGIVNFPGKDFQVKRHFKLHISECRTINFLFFIKF